MRQDSPWREARGSPPRLRNCMSRWLHARASVRFAWQSAFAHDARPTPTHRNKAGTNREMARRQPTGLTSTHFRAASRQTQPGDWSSGRERRRPKTEVPNLETKSQQALPQLKEFLLACNDSEAFGDAVATMLNSLYFPQSYDSQFKFRNDVTESGDFLLLSQTATPAQRSARRS